MDNNDLEYYKFVEGLKKVTRYKPFPSLHESVASHVYMTLLLACDIMSKYQLDLDRELVFNMLLIHDLPENGMDFDFPAPEIEKGDLKSKKRLLEEQKVKMASVKFARPHIKELFENFENDESREALFANFIDKFESAINILTNECQAFTCNEDFEFIIARAQCNLEHFPELTGLVRSVQEEINKHYEVFKKKNTEHTDA